MRRRGHGVHPVATFRQEHPLAADGAASRPSRSYRWVWLDVHGDVGDLRKALADEVLQVVCNAVPALHADSRINRHVQVHEHFVGAATRADLVPAPHAADTTNHGVDLVVGNCGVIEQDLGGPPHDLPADHRHGHGDHQRRARIGVRHTQHGQSDANHYPGRDQNVHRSLMRVRHEEIAAQQDASAPFQQGDANVHHNCGPITMKATCEIWAPRPRADARPRRARSRRPARLATSRSRDWRRSQTSGGRRRGIDRAAVGRRSARSGRSRWPRWRPNQIVPGAFRLRRGRGLALAGRPRRNVRVGGRPCHVRQTSACARPAILRQPTRSWTLAP